MSRRPPTPVVLQRVSTVEALVAALQEQVLDGTLPGGTKLREGELRDGFGVSRHTVRSALQALAHRGLVRHEPNRGAFVALLTPDDVDDLFRLRTVLELTAAREIAGDESALAQVQAAVDALEQLPGDAPWSAVRDADLHFHQALVEAIDSPRIDRSFESLLTELRLCFMQLRPELENAALVAEQHRHILATLQAGDVQHAVELLAAHLARSRDDIVAGFARQG